MVEVEVEAVCVAVEWVGSRWWRVVCWWWVLGRAGVVKWVGRGGGSRWVVEKRVSVWWR